LQYERVKTQFWLLCYLDFERENQQSFSQMQSQSQCDRMGAKQCAIYNLPYCIHLPCYCSSLLAGANPRKKIKQKDKLQACLEIQVSYLARRFSCLVFRSLLPNIFNWFCFCLSQICKLCLTGVINFMKLAPGLYLNRVWSSSDFLAFIFSPQIIWSIINAPFFLETHLFL
jgi:hypothetical protein